MKTIILLIGMIAWAQAFGMLVDAELNPVYTDLSIVEKCIYQKYFIQDGIVFMCFPLGLEDDFDKKHSYEHR